MNRRIAMSMLSVTAALALMGGSAFAAFTTTATATANTFAATTPGLLLTVDGGSEGNPVPGITVGGLIPGGPASVHTFLVHNTDTDTGAVQAVTLKFNDTGSTLPGTDTTTVVDCGQGAVSLNFNDWVIGHFIGNVNPTATMSCTMSVSLNSGAPSSDAGLSDHFDAVFTGSVGS